MSYYLYSKTVQGPVTHFRRINKFELFGKGLLWQELQQAKTLNAQPPWEWHIDVEQHHEPKNEAILIEMTPNRPKTTLLCELRDVCGYSDPSWTRYMWHMRVLLKDEPRALIDPSGDFDWDGSKRLKDNENVYTFAYANVNGKGFKPGGGQTTSVLLWPAVMRSFADCIKRQSPGVIS